MKKTLEQDLDAVFEQEDRQRTAAECARVIAKHAPKGFKEWPALLRKIADYIEAMPEPVELSAKAISGLIEMSFLLRDREEAVKEK